MGRSVRKPSPASDPLSHQTPTPVTFQTSSSSSSSVTTNVLMLSFCLQFTYIKENSQPLELASQTHHRSPSMNASHSSYPLHVPSQAPLNPHTSNNTSHLSQSCLWAGSGRTDSPTLDISRLPGLMSNRRFRMKSTVAVLRFDSTNTHSFQSGRRPSISALQTNLY
jgi:hypothetical protein